MTEEPPVQRYELRERVGAGGMGEVFVAWDTVLEREVALKLLHSNPAAAAAARGRLLREARMAATLSHPNICVVHDVGEMEGRSFVTMELLDGETLRSRLARGLPISLDEVSGIARAVAAALAEAHRHGIVHRDIKPENIMLLPDGRVKVLDFGLAKPVEVSGVAGCPILDPNAAEGCTTEELGPGETSPLTSASVTTPGSILGTFHYLSPEQAEARPVDARSDVFTFGVVLYEMLTGKRPFSGRSVGALLSTIRNDHPAALSALRQETPRPLARVVERCLNKRPDDRYASGVELLHELESAAKASRELKAARWRLLLPITAMMTIAAIASLWFLGRDHVGPPDPHKILILPFEVRGQAEGAEFVGRALAGC